MSQLRFLVLLTCLLAGVATANPLGRHFIFPHVVSVQWYPHGLAKGQPWVQVDLHSNGDTEVTRGKIGGRSDYEHNGLLRPAEVKELVQMVKDADLPPAAQKKGVLPPDVPSLDVWATLDGRLVQAWVTAPQAGDSKAWALGQRLLHYADPKDELR